MKSLIKKLLVITIVSLLAISLTSCDFDESKSRFSGGVLLDDNKMEEIREEVLSDFYFDEESMEDFQYETGNDLPSKDGDETEEPEEDVTTTSNEDGEIVYWTKSGVVWHTSADCSHISKSINVISGSVEEAKEAGKDKVCSRCNK